MKSRWVISFRILHDVGVVRGTQLHKYVPGLTKTRPPDGPPEHGFQVMQTVGFPVGQGIPVSIYFELTQFGVLEWFRYG